MSITRYKRKNPKDVLVYIEEINKKEGVVLFDFIDSNEFSSFSRYINNESDVLKASMVFLKNYWQKSIQVDTIYAIKKEVIEGWVDQKIINNEVDSFLIGYVIDILPSDNEIFEKSISMDPVDELFSPYGFFDPYVSGNGNSENFPIPYNGNFSFTVRDVGQGNWNEINFQNEVKIVYDVGASMFASKSEIRNIIDGRISSYLNSKPALILSHWDKDHYHTILGMTDDELKCFSIFICIDLVPNKTSRIIFGRIRAAIGEDNIIALQSEERLERGSPTYLIPITPVQNQVMIYVGQRNKNRNISGIVLSFKTRDSSVVFSGDCHYEQISRDVLPDLNFPYIHNLVVPHHGGEAGKFLYNLSTNIKAGTGIISVGKNDYKHPNPDLKNALLTKKFKLIQTNFLKKDITINI